jgi:hypothetical protein
VNLNRYIASYRDVRTVHAGKKSSVRPLLLVSIATPHIETRIGVLLAVDSVDVDDLQALAHTQN